MPVDIYDATAHAAFLKIKYGPTFVRQIGESIVALKLFGENNMRDWAGSRVQFPIDVGRDTSVMAMGSLGLLPNPTNLDSYEVQIPNKWVRGVIMFDIDVMQRSMSSEAAFVRANDYKMNRLKTDIVDERNRMLAAGNGRGIYAFVDEASGSTAGVLGVDSPGGIASNVYGSRYLQKGMVIAFVNPATSAIRSVRTITAVTSGAAASITLDADVTAGQATDNDWIVRVSNLNVTGTAGASSSLDNEPMGLEGIVANASGLNVLHNINRTTVPDFESTVINASLLGLDPLQQLTDTIDQQSREEITDHYTHHSVRRAYLQAADATRTLMQTGKGPQAFDIGQAEGIELSYNGKMIHVDRDAQLAQWLMLNRNHLQRYVLQPGQWADESGSMFKDVPGVDALQAYFRMSDNFSSDKPNSMGKITGLDTTDAIIRHVK